MKEIDIRRTLTQLIQEMNALGMKVKGLSSYSVN